MLRGLVLVIMVLDHARDDFVAGSTQNPMADPNVAPLLFFTRWITHFCAPVFVLLAGVSASMAAERRTANETSRALLLRGLWLVVLELTVVRFGWMFDVSYRFSFVQVIWAIAADAYAVKRTEPNARYSRSIRFIASYESFESVASCPPRSSIQGAVASR